MSASNQYPDYMNVRKAIEVLIFWGTKGLDTVDSDHPHMHEFSRAMDVALAAASAHEARLRKEQIMTGDPHEQFVAYQLDRMQFNKLVQAENGPRKNES
jgi:hypothetical protein